MLEHLYDHLKEKIDFHFNCFIDKVEKLDSGYRIYHEDSYYDGKECVISAGRSGSKWMENVCRDLDINTNSNRVDIGVRVELPAGIFAHLTDELYESKIVYRTSSMKIWCGTFCMNPKGEVVNENTNGIVTVNGHSYEDPAKQTNNTNFALLVAKHFSEPFKDSNGYGESIARLSNMLGGGVIVQRFGDLIKGRRSTEERIGESFTVPTLNAAAGDLSLVLPKRLLDGIIEMIYALDKIAPGTASDDTLLYGVEVKFYNMEVELDHNLMTRMKDFILLVMAAVLLILCLTLRQVEYMLRDKLFQKCRGRRRVYTENTRTIPRTETMLVRLFCSIWTASVELIPIVTICRMTSFRTWG